VKFKIKGNKNSTWGIKVKKLVDVSGQMREVTDKVHLNGGVEYNSENFATQFKCEKISYEKIKAQLGDNIIWEEEEKKEETTTETKVE